jgi:hypothetical protein
MDSISSLVAQENRLTAWTLQRDAIASHPGSRQGLVARDPHRNLLAQSKDLCLTGRRLFQMYFTSLGTGII